MLSLLPLLCVASGEMRAVSLCNDAIQIKVPKDWVLVAGQTSAGCSWLLTAEDTRLGPYQTGIRFELFKEVSAVLSDVPSKWCAKRVADLESRVPDLEKSTLAPIAGGLTGIQVAYQMEYAEKFSSAEYSHRRIWLWDDLHDVVLIIEARTAEEVGPLSRVITGMLEADFSPLFLDPEDLKQ